MQSTAFLTMRPLCRTGPVTAALIQLSQAADVVDDAISSAAAMCCADMPCRMHSDFDAVPVWCSQLAATAGAQLSSEERGALHFLIQCSALRLAGPSDPGDDATQNVRIRA